MCLQYLGAVYLTVRCHFRQENDVRPRQVRHRRSRLPLAGGRSERHCSSP